MKDYNICSGCESSYDHRSLHFDWFLHYYFFINNKRGSASLWFGSYWWKNPAGTLSRFHNLGVRSLSTHKTNMHAHTLSLKCVWPAKRNHTCLHKQTCTRWCCHRKDRSAHKLFIRAEREMKSMFTKRCTVHAKLNIQMVHRGGEERGGSFFFLPKGEQCVWIRIEPRDSEIAPFYCTSVYFESVSLAFLHLTWWLHRFPRGTEYISESGRSTGFLSARKQQLVREGLHLTTDLRSYLVWVYLRVPNKTSTLCAVKSNHCNSCNYNTEANCSNDGSFFVGFSVSVERIKASAHFLHSRFENDFL